MYDEYRELSRRLGIPLLGDLGIMTFSFALEGSLDGHPVRLERLCGSGAHILNSSPIFPPLDLGLGVSRAGFLASLTEVFGAEEIQIGEPAFDAAWALRGDEPERVKALLTPAVREAIRACANSELTITDQRFRSTAPVYDESPATLERGLREAIAVARLIEGAATTVPPASALRAHHASWLAFAEPHGLAVAPTPLSMSGRLGRVDLFARSVRKRANEFGFEFAVGTERPLDIMLLVRSRESARVAGLGVDAGAAARPGEFERIFEVHSADPARAAEFVDGELRRRLVELASFGAVFFDRRGVSVHANAADLDPARVGVLLESMRSLVELRFAGETGYR